MSGTMTPEQMELRLRAQDDVIREQAQRLGTASVRISEMNLMLREAQVAFEAIHAREAELRAEVESLKGKPALSVVGDEVE